jgi:hypothetical protein
MGLRFRDGHARNDIDVPLVASSTQLISFHYLKFIIRPADDQFFDSGIDQNPPTEQAGLGLQVDLTCTGIDPTQVHGRPNHQGPWSTDAGIHFGMH